MTMLMSENILHSECNEPVLNYMVYHWKNTRISMLYDFTTAVYSRACPMTSFFS